MRKYQRIWETLRDKKVARIIVADASLHRRIIQAVKKEKSNDLAFKVLSANTGNLYKLHYKVVDSEITFFLLPELSSKNL